MNRILLIATLILLIVGIWFHPGSAQNDIPTSPAALTLTDERDSYPLGLYLEILEDPSGELTIEEVSSPDFAARFTPSQAAVPNYGFTRSAYWLRFYVKNETQQTDHWLLEQGFANIQYIDLYSPLPNGQGFSSKQTGVLRPVETRDLVHPHIVFRLEIPTQSQQTYYLRVQTKDSMTLPLTLWTEAAFAQRFSLQQLWNGIFFGVLIGLLFYNLFLLFSLHERNHLTYVLLLVSLILTIVAYDGYAAIYLYPNSVYLKRHALNFTFALLIALMVLFSDSFLELRTRIPTLHRLTAPMLAASGILMLAILYSDDQLVTVWSLLWALLSLLFISIAAIISWLRGFRPVRFFLAAWLGLVITILLIVFVRMVWLPSNAITERAYLPGVAWMAVCWSIALADRIDLLKTEKEKAHLEVQLSEARYRQLVETMNDGLGIIDEHGHFTYVNRRFAEMLRYTPEEMTGHLATDFVDENNRLILQNQLTLRKAGGTNSYELTWCKKDGSDVFTLVSPRPLRKADGRYQGAFAVITDITERVMAQRLLEQRVDERTQELRTLLDVFRDISTTQDVATALGRIQERLKMVVDYYGMSILIQEENEWRTVAQNWSTASAPTSKIIHGKAEIYSWISVPLSSKKNITGMMVLACKQANISEEQMKVIEAAANAATIAIENERLNRQLREAATAEERNRMARELHDSVTQTLFTASVLAEATPRIWDKNQGIARQNLDKLSLLLRGALAEMRTMLIELRSGKLDDQTLEQLLTTLVEMAHGRSHAIFTASIMDVPDLPSEVTLALYRIAREALNNVFIHAKATQVNISVVEEHDRITLQIQDDGRGFDPQAVAKGHLGIKIMEERAAEIGADLQIHSQPGHGTELTVSWLRPIRERKPHAAVTPH